MGTTNVHPEELNYSRYSAKDYEDEIQDVIPGYLRLNNHISLAAYSYAENKDQVIKVLDLGAGTGLSSQEMLRALPNAQLTLVDFSEHMLKAAKRKFGTKANYICTDYAKLSLAPNSFDIVMSIIGLHHQNHNGKRKVINKVYKALRPQGIFILGDLVTFRDKRKTALAKARHFCNLMHYAPKEKRAEWAYHHEYLNDLADLEDLCEWMEEAGFEVTVGFEELQTALLVGRKL
jgi:tRNA (cmo5U34)-methyltransferase